MDNKNNNINNNIDNADVISIEDKAQVFIEQIDQAIESACLELDIDDLKAESQRPFKAVLRLVGLTVFPTRRELKDNNYIYNNNNNILTNNNKYDFELLDILKDYYIFLCDKYKKLISIQGYALMLNIDYSTIELWGGSEATSLGFKIYKNLIDERQDNLKAKLYDSSNVVGTISIGNTEYQWQMPGSKNTYKVDQLSVNNLPQLDKKEQ